jgi:TonB family C-terminal domain
MEIKKTPQASLENKRLLFAEIGLIVALLVVYAGFETSTRAQATASLIDDTKPLEEDDILSIPLDTPPPAPEVPLLPQLSDEIEIVDNNVTVDIDFQSLEDNDIPIDIKDYMTKEVIEEEVEEETFFVFNVEEQPTFNGGDANEFTKWVNTHIQYPQIAQEMSIQGKVTLQFTIEKDGSLQNVKVLSTPDESLSKEAVRVVSSSPKWKPGRQRDRAVKVTYTFPVVFKLR